MRLVMTRVHAPVMVSRQMGVAPSVTHCSMVDSPRMTAEAGDAQLRIFVDDEAMEVGHWQALEARIDRLVRLETELREAIDSGRVSP